MCSFHAWTFDSKPETRHPVSYVRFINLFCIVIKSKKKIDQCPTRTNAFLNMCEKFSAKIVP